jgi:hypothetical protein
MTKEKYSDNIYEGLEKTLNEINYDTPRKRLNSHQRI